KRVRLRCPAADGEGRLTAFGRCEYSRPRFNRHGSCPSFRERISARRWPSASRSWRGCRSPARASSASPLPTRQTLPAGRRTCSQRHCVVSLTFYDSGARSIYNSVRRVRTLADMKGVRIRVQQSDLMVDMIKALGAEPIELPYGQVSTGLSTKLIDGAENNWPSYVTTGHYKLAPYYTLTQHTMGPELLVMSPRAWESLSAEDKTVFRDAARKSSAYMRELWTGLEERSREQARAAGNTIITDFDRTPFEQAMNAIYAETVTDPGLRQLIERIRNIQ